MRCPWHASLSCWYVPLSEGEISLLCFKKAQYFGKQKEKGERDRNKVESLNPSKLWTQIQFEFPVIREEKGGKKEMKQKTLPIFDTCGFSTSSRSPLDINCWPQFSLTCWLAHIKPSNQKSNPRFPFLLSSLISSFWLNSHFNILFREVGPFWFWKGRWKLHFVF